MLSQVGHNVALLCTWIWKQLQVEVSVDLCAYTTIDCGRDTINVFQWYRHQITTSLLEWLYMFLLSYPLQQLSGCVARVA